MPTYVYSCNACGNTFERFERITAKPNSKCEKCGKSSAKRNISGGAGVIFKGSGFYTTDYRSSSYSEAAKKDSSGNGKTEPCSTCGDPKGPGACKTESKAESKSEKKSEGKSKAKK